MTTSGRRAGLSRDHRPDLAQRGRGPHHAHAGSYRPGLKADRLPCPILVQIADRDAVPRTRPPRTPPGSPPGAARCAQPVGHFDIYTGAPFERAVADQLHSCAGTWRRARPRRPLKPAPRSQAGGASDRPGPQNVAGFLQDRGGPAAVKCGSPPRGGAVW